MNTSLVKFGNLDKDLFSIKIPMHAQYELVQTNLACFVPEYLRHMNVV